MWKQVLFGCGGAVALATAAFADNTAIATGNLNIRSGPGTGFSIVGVTPAGNSLMVHGCVAGSMWCAVNSGGLEGWSYSSWLASASGTPVASDFWVRSYGAGDLASYTYAGRAAAATQATYASTTPVRTYSHAHGFGTYASTTTGYGAWGYGAYPGYRTYASTGYGWGYGAYAPRYRTFATTAGYGAFGYGGGYRQGQYAFDNVNGRDTLMDTRNGAVYLRNY